MIECPQCGFANELGRIFCHQCGNKLDLDKIKAPTQGAKMRRRVAGGMRKTVRTVIELVIAVGLIAFIWLICLVPDVKPVKATNAELVAVDSKRLALDRLVSGRKDGSLTISAGEFDAYVNTLGFEKPKGTGVEFTTVALRTDFGDGTVTIRHVGSLQLGSALHKQFYFGLAGTPAAGGGEFTFKPTGAWIGKLPIQPKLIELTGVFQDYFAKLFAKLDNERKSLDKLSSVTVTPGNAVLTYQPAAAK